MSRYITSLLLFSSLLISCNELEMYKPVESLPINSSDVTFSADGGTGKIRLSGVADCKAVSSDEWCVVSSCSGGVIEFSVEPNTSLEERVSILSIKAGEAEGDVAITQMGIFIDNEPDASFCYGNNAAFDRLVKFSSSQKVEVVTTAGADWLKYEVTADGVRFSAPANNTGRFRNAVVSVSSGQVSCRYEFLQFGIDDIAGDWKMEAVDDKAVKAEDEVSIIKEADGTLLMEFSVSGYKDIRASIKNNALAIDCGQSIPSVNPSLPYEFVVGVYPLGVGNMGLSSKVFYQMNPSVDADGELQFCFADNGMLGTPVTAFAIWACDPETNSVAGYWDLLSEMRLYK